MTHFMNTCNFFQRLVAIILAATLAAAPLNAQTVVTPIGSLKLTGTADANLQTIQKANSITWGSANDATLARTGAGILTLTGNLVVSGNITGSGTSTANFSNTGLKVYDTDASHLLTFAVGSNLTANRTLTFSPGDGNRTVTLGGDLTTSGAFNTTLTVTANTTLTLPTSGTLSTQAGAESLTNKKLGSLTSNGLVTTSGGDGTLSVTVPGTGVLTALGVNVGSAGAPVVNGGALGTPSSGTLTNATGLPIATGVANLGTGVATALTTPSSANLRSAVTDESGTGALLFAGGDIGAATGTSLALSSVASVTGALTLGNAGSYVNFGAAGVNGYVAYGTNLEVYGPASGSLAIRNGNASGSLILSGTSSGSQLTLSNAGALTVPGTGTHTFGTTNTVTATAGVLTATAAAGPMLIAKDTGTFATDASPQISFRDGSAEGAYIGFANGANNDFTVAQLRNASLYFRTNNTLAGGFDSTQNFSALGTGAHTFGGLIRSTAGDAPSSAVTAAHLSVAAAAPRITFTDSTGAVNSKVSDIVQAAGGGDVRVRFRDDSASNSTIAYKVTGAYQAVGTHTFYTGNEVATATINSTATTLAGNLTVSGTAGVTSAKGFVSTDNPVSGLSVHLTDETAPAIRFTKSNVTARSFQLSSADNFTLEDVTAGTAPLVVTGTTGATTITGPTLTLQNGAANPTVHVKATANTYNPTIRLEGWDRTFYVGVRDTGADGLFSIASTSALTSPLFSIDAGTGAAVFSGNVTAAGAITTLQNGTADPTLHIKTTADTYNPNLRLEGFNRNLWLGLYDTGADGELRVSTASTFANPLFTLTSVGGATFLGNLTVSGTGTHSFAGPIAGTASAAGLVLTRGTKTLSLNANYAGGDAFAEITTATGMGVYISPGTSGAPIVTLTTAGKSTIAGATGTDIKGTTTNDNAATGYVGEYVSSTVASGSAVDLAVAGTVYNVTLVSLTAGDWDVSGVVAFAPNAATTILQLVGGISTTSATLGSGGSFIAVPWTGSTMGTNPEYALPVQRITLTATTDVRLVARGNFAVNTLGAYGVIRARRVR